MKFEKGKWLIIAVLALMFFCMSGVSASASDTQALAEAKKCLKLSGVIETIKATMPKSIEQTIIMIRQAKPLISDKELTQYKDFLQKEMMEGLKELEEKVAVSYAKHYSLDELKELNRLYSTPIGKKIRQSTINLTPELTDAVQAWSIKVIQKAMLQMQKR